ncbi:CusA/CzcA family heavy metal efflux RND transporter [Pedobacter heparinus]|uniref:Heavy metal efflux pump, CzcA family n=1 Tax=Pedobacter heparinus (strain ATCC 13125 / DSM 2366 / CIP 104194 / JCM 7457 / NBRC 12017 / NCIMB 9290 / NRRL B-14731 / HIM 762-3) TaxID=485917 RepID=C6Y0V7_PEDHD|nr:CusA/CzcA family heavy metal efflux RND transporter [Pedobacter heparinus]ACU04884.1 heavy metal efflux pump, CzcA family [Pedobacter heparinus DSM 2366]
MFNRIILFSIKNKLAIGIMTLALVVWGIYSLTQLPIDAVPDITNNQVQIISQAPSLGAQEVEQFITAPIELGMANIPNVIEKRSISRSGISVITIVFEDDTDIYWARQQVAAQLKEAENNIPAGLAEPTLAPITTGLGEIYQYVLHTKKGYEDQYTATDLRTLQDWVVRTQLAGTKGVAEVSGWGGYVKQYEIALDNEKLNASNVTISQIYAALKNNNENTGGSYIEQQSNAYTIRGIGQVKSLEDIEKIVVKNAGGVPLLIRDIGSVQFGSATRYGAVTRNGTGEVVAGITLMLKGENFNQVIKNVKERIAQIQKSLPEGVVIEPYIDRTELVGRSISTVQKNLIEGALIVIFVLLLLLGNWRAGLIVASVIPLSMLFAFAMMRLFGVSGNLMSLGAIDFGLIVDGAVIIVEAIIFRLTESKLFKGTLRLDQQQMDQEVFTASSKIRASATFGEIIILIVYLPLLSLVGIEGKMFKPMAETVVFAIVGAFILSLTYVPMISALLLSKNTEHKRTISDRIVDGCKNIYKPLLEKALEFKKIVVTIAMICFACTLLLFSRMGGEFLPQLEEGDLAVEIAMSQGTSLTQVVETFGKAEKILKDKFPEVKQVVTRIGSAEIPTDPMPVERGDMMVAMLPKSEWTSAKTKEEMTEKMEAALSILPGVNIEITQPMQMRFNELMTGVRQDVAVKIYGEDLDVLAQQAAKVAKLIAPVKGVSEPFVEQVTGLPQVVVTYDRDKIAQYGLTIGDINNILKTAFAGDVAGVVFEGEKRFDMVVRLQRDLRENISSIENLYIPLPSGNKVPLNQVAKIELKDAPAQISREDGKRRIYVGFNVKGRDVERTVAEIQQVLDARLKLPPGYYLTYGGQFQNLKEAKNRLSVAVPVAMLLILGLLYFTFRSVSQTILIFTAVPLSAIGGVLALMLRGMPFSISAGVGFIALFGVAVLNGIVLISYFNQLKEEGITDVYKRVMQGTAVRLRPVIMTAAVASLGFLPMALSGGAGAEVQKPLATVVIGGLLSATLLTLFVLPCLYILVTDRKKIQNNIMKPLVIIFLLFGGLAFTNQAKAQQAPLSADSAVALALKNNLQLKSAGLSVSQSKARQKTAFDPSKTAFTISQDPTGGGSNDNSISVSQNFAWPGFYKNQKRVLSSETGLMEKSADYTRAEISRDTRLAYYHLLYSINMLKVLELQDSIYKHFIRKSELRYKVGETSNLELITARNKYQEVQALKKSAAANLATQQLNLQQLLNLNTGILPSEKKLPILTLTQDGTGTENTAAGNLLNAVYQQQVEIAKAKVELERSRTMPDLTFGYAQQFVIKSFDPANIGRTYTPGTRIAGLQLGIAVPLFNGAGRARINNEKIAAQIAETDYQRIQNQLNTQYQQEMQNYAQHKAMADYFTTEGLKQAEEQIRIAQVSYDLGEIGYIEFIQNMSLAVQSKLNYLQTVNQLNQSVIQLQFLKGN